MCVVFVLAGEIRTSVVNIVRLSLKSWVERERLDLSWAHSLLPVKTALNTGEFRPVQWDRVRYDTMTVSQHNEWRGLQCPTLIKLLGTPGNMLVILLVTEVEGLGLIR